MARRFSFPQPPGSQAQAEGSRHPSGGTPVVGDDVVPLPVWRLMGVAFGAMLGIGGLFALRPQLDLTIAGVFWQADHFIGDTAGGRLLRQTFELVPLALLAGLTICYGLRRFAGRRVWAPNGAGLLMLAASLALGPGLLVNVVLKDHSHRPRPVQVTAFGGPWAFRPFDRFDGACSRNCSFVSGEGSSAAWTLAPALLAPPPLRVLAVAVALVFAAATALLRMAFGGHFASDSLFAALFSWVVILACWRAAGRLAKHPPALLPPPAPV